jgi:hypothetical protein
MRDTKLQPVNKVSEWKLCNNHRIINMEVFNKEFKKLADKTNFFIVYIIRKMYDFKLPLLLIGRASWDILGNLREEYTTNRW